jgi:hypothetical protein
VLANKQDVKGSLGAAKISEALGLSKLKDRQWHIQVRSQKKKEFVDTPQNSN